MKKTKIVVTLGPATSTLDDIKSLAQAGANMFRINTSHGSLGDHKKEIQLVRQAAKELGLYLPILIDLQGPKIRIGILIEPIELELGHRVVLMPSQTQTSPEFIPVDYEGIVNDVKLGELVMIDDGKIHLRVTAVDKDKVFCEVVNPGLLKQRKGLNIPGATASLDAVTPRDIEFIKFAVEQEADYIALSFVREQSDIELAKKYINEFGGNIPIIAKIEKPQAVDNMVEIIGAADGVMVARGDLGIEISPEHVPIVQKKILNEATKQCKVAIVATQMLETMVEQPIPTRAEASDIANAIIDGTDAIMLSGETSVGKYAKESVAMMASIAADVESSQFCPYNVPLEISGSYELTPQSIVVSAVRLAQDVNAKAILAFTHTGYSTKFMSKIRPKVPIFAISDMEKTCRKLSLYWNVIPFEKNWDSVLCRDLLQDIDAFLLEHTFLEKEDRIILTGSIPKLITGRTNFIRVHRIGATSSKDV